ncbi:hypothetical protein [Limosilactobacillus reuteri]|uniref:hypothetical protein n=1 Tax=Limosilactobacillus reuteri TaxID=1598 RepID=UPI002B061258|nr:hypothetical protein [Limosilactobacillus reuteri]
MTAINTVNLDEQFSFDPKRKVIIGGKTYELTFNDKLQEALTNLQITMVSAADSLEKEQEKFINDMDVKQRKQLIQNTMKSTLKNLKQSLDDVLGKGEGERLYKYYKESTHALSAIAQELIKIDDEVNGEKKDTQKAKKKALRKHYASKKRRG